ncbi:hypothetical protein BOX15_Mlig013622g1 [Macrostomum lignano]|uniref:Uncharacterized protein n=1 Tax=Macrostomum lignano TaxID=282301 RepID=A0A267EBB2_9PLAT|nr:hypothetical protein BOX15_Mlig013622g2 [Macrostomum lignano]PAA65442.1 hypothetical protein BOX15_Mlig013622g1 [Macrostomum lignano]
MLNSAAAGRRQVNDFNTVADEVRPGTGGSARSDPGVRGGGVEPAEPDRAPTPAPAPSVDEEEANVDVGGVETTDATEQRLPAPSTPQEFTSLTTSPPPPPMMHTPSQENIESPALQPADRELLARSQPANTPTTPCTVFSKRPGVSRPSQQTANTTMRRNCYEQAVNLVAARCVTNPLVSPNWQRQRSGGGDPADDPPPGFGGPRVFYIRQKRPRPMTPLKAWAGYHGNVYFSPLRIRRSEFAHPDSQLSLPSLPACSGRLQQVLESSRLNAEHLLLLRARSDAAAMKRRPPPRRAAMVGGQSSGQQPLVQLDRAYLASRAASRQQGPDGPETAGGTMSVSRDVHLYRSAHATGTLQFQNQQLHEQPQQFEPEPQPTAGRVYRGSVSRKLRDLRLTRSTETSTKSPTGSQRQQQLRQAHNNSMVSLDRGEIDRLYDQLPSLMASVPRSQARQFQSGTDH